MNDISPIVDYVFKENAFVHVTNIGGFAIELEQHV
jgi:hypothetical protein